MKKSFWGGKQKFFQPLKKNMYELDYNLFQCRHKDYVKTFPNVFRFESIIFFKEKQKTTHTFTFQTTFLKKGSK